MGLSNVRQNRLNAIAPQLNERPRKTPGYNSPAEKFAECVAAINRIRNKDFHHWCHQEHRKLGSAWIWSGAQGARVINLITQDGGYDRGSKPGKASISSVNHSLRALKGVIVKEGLSSVALPRLATGVGGLSWKDVRPLILNQLADIDADVFVYQEYVPGKKADEPGRKAQHLDMRNR